ncbi:MAG TPA: hypothetical protein VFI82_12455 [Terriglobales bacterium]|nr:hypothetical protein [Terriglobales bacterium]
MKLSGSAAFTGAAPADEVEGEFWAITEVEKNRKIAKTLHQRGITAPPENGDCT